MKLKSIWNVFKATIDSFTKDRAVRLAASLAYYAIFSIGPLLFMLILLAGAVFGEEAVRAQILQQMTSFVGEQAAKTIESMIAAHKTAGSIVTTIVGIVSLVIGASGVFGQLQDALNAVWEVQPKSGIGLWGYLRSRFLSLSMVFGLGFLLLISMVLTTILDAIATSAGQVMPFPKWLMGIASGVFSFVVVALFFALIFKFLPDVKLKWRNVWIGAVGTSALFTTGKYFMSLYLSQQSTASTYGAAGSVIVLLLWVYYASLILLIGAEFTKTYTSAIGDLVRPNSYAEPITQEARAQQGTPEPTPAPVAVVQAPQQQMPANNEPALAPREMPAQELELIYNRLPTSLSSLGAAWFAGVLTGWLVLGKHDDSKRQT